MQSRAARTRHSRCRLREHLDVPAPRLFRPGRPATEEPGRRHDPLAAREARGRSRRCRSGRTPPDRQGVRSSDQELAGSKAVAVGLRAVPSRRRDRYRRAPRRPPAAPDGRVVAEIPSKSMPTETPRAFAMATSFVAVGFRVPRSASATWFGWLSEVSATASSSNPTDPSRRSRTSPRSCRPRRRSSSRAALRAAGRALRGFAESTALETPQPFVGPFSAGAPSRSTTFARSTPKAALTCSTS